MTVSLFVQVTVKDYDAWKTLYDSNTQVRADNGVLSDTVHRHPENRNSVMVCNKFANQEKLNDFFAFMQASSDEFEKAGILKTEMWFGEDV